MTPLHLAAQRGRYNLVGYLVGKDANVNAKDLNGVKLQTTSACWFELVYFHAARRGAVSNYVCCLDEKLAASSNKVFNPLVV